MHCPVYSNKNEADDEAKEFWDQQTYAMQQPFFCCFMAVEFRNFYFNYQKCNGYCKHSIAEEDEAFQLELFFYFVVQLVAHGCKKGGR